MRKITRDVWEQKHPDFKTVDEEGQHHVLRLDPDTGATVLEPVEIVDDSEEENRG